MKYKVFIVAELTEKFLDSLCDREDEDATWEVVSVAMDSRDRLWRVVCRSIYGPVS